ncbi:MAG: capsid protein [Wigfec virus K19_493]|nr:MAG: capsid protein [Wigfec virus K19_493]
MPFRRRRRWKKFVRRVRSVLNKSLGTISIVMNSSILASSANGTQNLIGMALYGARGLDSRGYRDLWNIFTGVIGNAVTIQRHKLLFKSGVLDVTFANVASEENASMELDVYEYIAKRRTVGFSNAGALVTDAEADNLPLAAPFTDLLGTTCGWTPFQSPSMSQYLRWIKKTKFMLGVGQSCTYQMRDPRDHLISGELLEEGSEVNATGMFALPPYTRGLLVVFKGVPNGTSGCPAVNLHAGITRTYSVAELENNENRDGAYP